MKEYTFGIGCDRGTSLETVEGLVKKGLQALSLDPRQVRCLASIDKKSDEVALIQLAQQYQWRLVFFSAQQLADVLVPNPSAVVMRYMGTPTVAEGAAILAAQGTQDDLVIEKLKHKGADQKNATLSVAKVKHE